MKMKGIVFSRLETATPHDHWQCNFIGVFVSVESDDLMVLDDPSQSILS